MSSLHSIEGNQAQTMLPLASPLAGNGSIKTGGEGAKCLLLPASFTAGTILN